MLRPDPLRTAYVRTLGHIRQGAAAGAMSAWDALPAYSEDNVGTFLADLDPLLRAGQQSTIDLADAYTAARLGAPFSGVDPESLTGDAVRRGFGGGDGESTEDVYRRPFLRVWSRLGEGAPLATAVDAGRAEMLQWLDTDLTASSWAGMGAAGDVAGAYGYVRVPSGGNVCGFCITAASQTYRTPDLAELHASCSCVVEPVANAGQADQVRQPFLDAYREHVEPALSDKTDELGRPSGSSERRTRELSRMSHQRFDLGQTITPT